jgi:hypothetical protein
MQKETAAAQGKMYGQSEFLVLRVIDSAGSDSIFCREGVE